MTSTADKVHNYVHQFDDESPDVAKVDPRTSLANAMIVVDVQNDFTPGGSLAVEGGDEVARRIHDYVQKFGDDYKLVVATLDWHPDSFTWPDFPHFSDNPDYVDTWPVHCVHDTDGAAWHQNLYATAKNAQSWADPWPPQADQIEFDLAFYKGQMAPAYSGFEGTSPGASFDPPIGWTLNAYLKDKNIGHVDVVGLATDYCVKATALDAVKAGYDTSVLLIMCAGVHPDSTEQAIKDMVAAGIHVEEED